MFCPDFFFSCLRRSFNMIIESTQSSSNKRVSLKRNLSTRHLSVIAFSVTLVATTLGWVEATTTDPQKLSGKETESWIRNEAEPLVETLISDLFGVNNHYNFLKKRYHKQKLEGQSDERVAKRYVSHMSRHVGDNLLRKDKCRPTSGGDSQFYCPSPDSDGMWWCVTLEQYCNGQRNCPNGEDEDPMMCFFHKPIVSRLEDISRHNLDLEGSIKRVEGLLRYEGYHVEIKPPKGKEVRLPDFTQPEQIPVENPPYPILSNMPDMYEHIGQNFNSQNLQSVARGHTVSHYSAFLEDVDRGRSNSHKFTTEDPVSKPESFDDEIAHLPEE